MCGNATLFLHVMGGLRFGLVAMILIVGMLDVSVWLLHLRHAWIELGWCRTSLLGGGFGLHRFWCCVLTTTRECACVHRLVFVGVWWGRLELGRRC